MRRFFVTVLLGVAGLGAIMWWFGLWPSDGQAEGRPGRNKKDDFVETSLGELLYPASKTSAKLAPKQTGAARPDPIVISAQFTVVDKTELSPEVDGLLLFVGEEIPDVVVAAVGVAPFMADPFSFAPIDLGRYYTADMDNLIFAGNRVLYKFFRRLEEGNVVGQDQLVAMLNPAKALSELSIRKAKFQAAVADLKIADSMLKESLVRLARAEQAYNKGAIPREEYDSHVLTRDKYYHEQVQKKESIHVARLEVEVAETQLKQHEIRNTSIRPFGRVKMIHKNGGDTVKAADPLIQLVSNDYLVAEGMIDIENASRVRAAAREGAAGAGDTRHERRLRVILEPTHEQAPDRKLQAHHGEVTAVAITRDGGFLSASEDKTVCLWGAESWPLRQFEHPEPVRSLACSPPGVEGNWCAAGLADGSIYLWDLNKAEDKPAAILRQHTDTVTTLAFTPKNPNGQWLASGAADNLICLWRLDAGRSKPDDYMQYCFDPNHGVGSTDQHHGPVTSLHFTPHSRLISAGRDGTLRVWEVHEKGARLERKREGRGNTVAQLGVDHLGKWMLYDKMGKELHVLSVEDGRYVCSLQNPHGAIPFETLAVFSPDEQGSLLLTGGAAEGRLQMWRTPSERERGFEVRQLVPPEKSAVTSAAFSHNAGSLKGTGAFVVSGSKTGYVYVWPVPGHDELDRHRITDVRPPIVNDHQENTRQARVHIGLRNPIDPDHPDGRLIPGRPVTIVIESAP